MWEVSPLTPRKLTDTPRATQVDVYAPVRGKKPGWRPRRTTCAGRLKNICSTYKHTRLPPGGSAYDQSRGEKAS
ncbi:hypothetical protein GCM10020216_043110 [Nonomuraea helvata]